MRTTSELLAYYQNHAEEAFSKGFTAKLHHECLGSEIYDTYRYYIPCLLAKRIRWLRHYFDFQDNQKIDIVYKRRKHKCEFAETSVTILNRIDMLTSRGNVIVAGSRYICALPWAIFGAVRNRISQHNFEDVTEIAKFYHNYLHGQCYPMNVCFRYCPNILYRLAKRFKEGLRSSPNYWLAVSLALVYDILHFCGPDTNEFFELFTNDYRENTDNIDVLEWQKFRHQTLERHPPHQVQVFDNLARRFYSVVPKRSRKVKIEIEEISTCQNLALGEITRPVFERRAVGDPRFVPGSLVL